MAVFIALIGAWFGFANPLLHLPAFILLFPCGVIWLATTARNPSQAFKRGWLAGLAAYSACLYWVVLPVHYYGPLPWILALPCPILIGIVLGLFPAAFALGLAWLDRRLAWWSSGLFAGALWASLELLRSQILTGFPWLSLPQALAPWPEAIQGLQLIGTFCFSGIMVVICAWLLRGLKQPNALLAACLLLIGLVVYGIHQIDRPQPTSGSFSASIVQGNIDQSRKWDSQFQNSTVERYLDMSYKEIERHGPDLLLWPETAMPFYLQEKTEYRARLERFVSANQIPLLTGAPGYEYQRGPESGMNQLAMFNRAYLFQANGTVTAVYEKEHLVPFGEYVPLKSLLPFLDSLVPGQVDFSPGKRTAPLNLNDLALGGLICYEVIFPGLVQERVQAGANVLINLSNDAWFGRSSAPAQHLHQAVLRAVEQNRFLLRTTNTGISAVIDPRGRIVSRTPLFEKAALHDSDIRLIERETIFSRHYTFFTALPPVLTALLGLLALLKPARRSGTSGGDRAR
jgi:apolipoprotein N-acyltransferase